MDPITEIELQAIHSFVLAGIPYDGYRVSRLMRTVTEAFHFGGIYYPSTPAKRINRTVSHRAAELMAVSSKVNFPQRTILEHTLPLKAMYNELLKIGSEFRFKDIEAYFANMMRECPLVTVTREEDRLLRNNLPPAERYIQAGIEIGVVAEMRFGAMPVWTRLAQKIQVVPDSPAAEDEETPGGEDAAEIADRREHMSWGPGDIEVLD